MKNRISTGTLKTSARSTKIGWVIAALFILAFAVRLGYFAANGVVETPDSVDYMRLAENLRGHGTFSLDVGEPLVPTIRRAPLYPVFLTAFIASGDVSARAAVLAQILLDACLPVLIFLLVNTSLSLRWALAAGIGYALHPGAIYFTTAILSESLFTTLSVAGVFFAIKGIVRDRAALTALAGATFGLATLCRPIGLPFAFLIAALSILVLRVPRGWLHSLLLIAFTSLIIVPWTIRSSYQAEHLVLVQGGSSVLFYVATRTDWNQKDQETLWARFSTEDQYGRRLVGASNPREMAEADQFGTQLAFQNIRNNPKAYLVSRARNFPFLFITSFDIFTGTHKSFSAILNDGEWLKLMVKASLLLVFALAPLLLGLAGLLGDWRDPVVSLPALVWVYTALANFPMWIEYRYWVSAVPFLMMSAAVGLQLLAKKFHRITNADSND